MYSLNYRFLIYILLFREIVGDFVPVFKTFFNLSDLDSQLHLNHDEASLGVDKAFGNYMYSLTMRFYQNWGDGSSMGWQSPVYKPTVYLDGKQMPVRVSFWYNLSNPMTLTGGAGLGQQIERTHHCECQAHGVGYGGNDLQPHQVPPNQHAQVPHIVAVNGRVPARGGAGGSGGGGGPPTPSRHGSKGEVLLGVGAPTPTPTPTSRVIPHIPRPQHFYLGSRGDDQPVPF
jgi:hypothetical protein